MSMNIMKQLAKMGLIGLLVMASASPVCAEEMPDAEEVYIAVAESGDDFVEVEGDARGTYLSSVNAILTKDSSSVADVYVDVICHENVSKIRLSVTLQRNDGSSSWENVDQQSFTWLGSDYDNELSYASVSYKVRGLTSGSTYRIKATGSCTSTSGTTETRTLKTSGLTF